MKTNKAFLSAVLTVFFALPAFGQYGTMSDSTKSGTMDQAAMGKPVYESTVQGTHLKVWIMTQADHKKMMDSKSMRDSTGMDRLGTDMSGSDKTSTGMGTGSSSMSTTTGTGTHHMMVEATDGSTGQSLSSITGTVQITSPSMKTSSVDLQPMTNHYGADLNLDEKGQYQFTLNLTVDGTSKTAQFQYTPGSSRTMNR